MKTLKKIFTFKGLESTTHSLVTGYALMLASGFFWHDEESTGFFDEAYHACQYLLGLTTIVITLVWHFKYMRRK